MQKNFFFFGPSLTHVKRSPLINEKQLIDVCIHPHSLGWGKKSLFWWSVKAEMKDCCSKR